MSDAAAKQDAKKLSWYLYLAGYAGIAFVLSVAGAGMALHQDPSDDTQDRDAAKHLQIAILILGLGGCAGTAALVAKSRKRGKLSSGLLMGCGFLACVLFCLDLYLSAQLYHPIGEARHLLIASAFFLFVFGVVAYFMLKADAME